ncbi:MAG: Uma2 family endonuclease [Bacteroidota bacterium]
MLIVEGHAIHLDKNPNNLTNDELYDFCVMNQELRIERDAQQNIIIMAPVGGYSGYREIEFMTEINIWVRKNGGIAFSSSTGFLMPNGAMRSPDACWVSEERWSTITAEQKKKFPPVTPDFVVEVRSATDSLKTAKAKMEEWIENGVRLGWLVDFQNKQVFIYREDGSIEIVKGLQHKLSGEKVLEGFEFNLKQLKMP